MEFPKELTECRCPGPTHDPGVSGLGWGAGMGTFYKLWADSDVQA